MRKAILLGAVGLALLWSKPAHADGMAWDNYCINDAFVVCASVRINVSASGNLIMQVWNMEGVYGSPHTITSIGLYHTGGWGGSGAYHYAHYVDGSGPDGYADVSTSWTSPANDIETLGGVNLQLSTGTSGNDGINGCAQLPGGTKWLTCNSFDGEPYMEFKFQLSGWNSYSAKDFELRWHSQQVGPDFEDSLKCDTGGYGDYGPCTQVPEPITIALLGSGLASMGGVGLFRRRKKGLDV
jgi:hypothetical protein